MGVTTQYLFQRIEEHCRSSSSICRHFQQDHDTSPRSLDLISQEFHSSEEIPRKDCLSGIPDAPD